MPVIFGTASAESLGNVVQRMRHVAFACTAPLAGRAFAVKRAAVLTPRSSASTETIVKLQLTEFAPANGASSARNASPAPWMPTKLGEDGCCALGRRTLTAPANTSLNSTGRKGPHVKLASKNTPKCC